MKCEEQSVKVQSSNNSCKAWIRLAKYCRNWPNLAEIANALVMSNAEWATVKKGFRLLLYLRIPTRRRQPMRFGIDEHADVGQLNVKGRHVCLQYTAYMLRGSVYCISTQGFSS